jgi:outer membrane protein assembly factor BamB
MDPLSSQLACDCVAGYAQRDYDRLGRFLTQKLSRPVKVAFTETLVSPQFAKGADIDLVIGKFSEVTSDARRISFTVRSLAMLSGNDGTVTQTGLFVVRQEDPATGIDDLADYRILFGPEDADEKRTAAFAALEAFGLPIPDDLQYRSSCSTAALAVAEGDADAAVISSYAMPLVEGCGTVDKGALRVIWRTDPVPFIGVFATGTIDHPTEQRVVRALLDVGEDPELLAALESKSGFAELPAVVAESKSQTGWPDWRGPGRHAHSRDVPTRLTDRTRLLWSRTMTGPGMAGVSAGSGRLVVADKCLDEAHDIFRCLDADTGREIWKVSYPAEGEMDFTNSPRANPVIHDGLVYLLGAFGDLRCVDLETGRIVWAGHLVQDFGAERPAWGYSSTPLVVDDKLIVNPGAEDASVVALDRKTGAVLWKSPGTTPGYAGFVLATLGGVRQIVSYDAVSLGGWDPDSGRRLWRLAPEFDGDFNVPTPIVTKGRLLVTTENNGTRLYCFDSAGRIQSKPLAMNQDLAPDTSTPVALDGLVFGNHGALVCLDLEDQLKTLWEEYDDEGLTQYCSFIAGNGHVLVTSQTGEIHLIRADRQRYDCVGRLSLFDDVADTDREVWSHPALVGNRLYIRNLLAVYCFLLR